ncbi:APC family permease [Streptosporangium sp. NPDC050855]|uniref:APC family permease n=1 Tax=Streptosporangium sp. NPDC050855 TaxID=3366194 RepID=UPI00378E7C33
MSTTADSSKELHKTLTISRGVGLAVSMIVGSGLLVLPGLAYASVGSAAVFAWVAAAIMVIPLLLVFSKLGSRYPSAGGVIGFMQAAFGRRVASPVAYVLLGATACGGAAMAITGGNYTAVLLGMPDAVFPATLAYLAVVAVLNALGSRLAGGVQTVVTALLVLLIAVVAAVPFVTPGFEMQGSVSLPVNWLDLLPAVGLVFFAFTGWELVASTTEEYHDPRRDLPLVLAASFVVIVVLYVGIATAVQVSLDPNDPMVRQAPVAAVLKQVFGAAAGTAAAVLGALIVFATLMGGTWATSRIIFATARERLLPARLTVCNRVNGAPVAAIVVAVLMFGTVVVLHGVEVLTLDQVFRLSAVNFIIGYAMSALAYGTLFRGPRNWLLVVLACAPVVVLLIGFGWMLLYPLGLLIAGSVVHVLTAEKDPVPVAAPPAD